MNAVPFDPKLLGLWIRMLRMDHAWSQEALAAEAGLTVRTLQRVEAGDPSSVTTRRALARALSYEDKHVFNDPDFARSVESLIKEASETVRRERQADLDARYPDHMRLKVEHCVSGHVLAQLVENADAFVFDIREGVPSEATQLSKVLFDSVDDYGMIWADLAPSGRVALRDSLGDLVSQIHDVSAKTYIAERNLVVGPAEGAQMRWKVGYLVVFEEAASVSEIMVSRKLPA